MPTDADRFSPYVAADQSIQSDVPCWKCGYSLRGAGRGHDCSECGEPVENTLVQLLAVQPGRWVKGLGVAALGFVLVVGLAIASMAVGMVISASMLPALGQVQAPDPVREWAAKIANWLPHVALFIVLFLLSVTNPASATDPSRRWQLHVRRLTVLAVLFFVISLFVPERFRTAALGVSLLSVAFELAALLVALQSLRVLLLRAQSPRGARLTTFLIGSGIPLLFCAVLGTLSSTLGSQDLPAPPYAMTVQMPTSAPAGVSPVYMVIQPDGSILHAASLPSGVPLYEPKDVFGGLIGPLSCVCAPLGLAWIMVAAAAFTIAAGSFWNAARLGDELRGAGRQRTAQT